MENRVGHIGICKLADFISKHSKMMRYTLIYKCVKFYASTSFSLKNISPHTFFRSCVTVLLPIVGAQICKIKSKKNLFRENALRYQ